MKIDNLSYEETLKELEEIIKELEDGESTLEANINKFKKGIDLYNHCNDLLTKVEGEVKIVLKDTNGSIKDEEFLMEG